MEVFLNDVQQGSPIIAYCEKGAWVQVVKDLCTAGAIKLIHFPYDEGDRRWHTKNGSKITFAKPSLVTADTTEIFCGDDFCISDTEKSELYDKIAQILNIQNKEFDVRHFDSAYKSLAQVFITNDVNYHNHRDALFALTGVEVIFVRSEEDLKRLQQMAMAKTEPPKPI